MKQETEDKRPLVTLPGNGVEIGDAGEQLGLLLGARERHFLFHDQVVRLAANERGGAQVTPIKAVELASDLEVVARFRKINVKGEERPATCSEGKANEILHSQRFREALPRLRQFFACPVITEWRGQLFVIKGYDRESGIFAAGDPPAEMPLHEAVSVLKKIFADFKFATPSDRSRAFAAVIAPGLAAGGLLKGRVPVDLGEADKSQTGKGFRNKLTAAVYRQSPCVINQSSKRGSGSLEASFSAAVMQGHSFISIDNVRGPIDSQSLESFMTESVVIARAAYTAETTVETQGVNVMITSNKAELTVDLANRASCVKLLKLRVGTSSGSTPKAPS